MVSGLPTDSFLYLGYLPHKTSERQKAVAQVANLNYTLIFLESPHRMVDSLQDLLSVLGDRRICVAREMTKLYEEFWRGPISGAIEHFNSREPRGEFTLVIEGKKTGDRGVWTKEELLEAIQKELNVEKSAKEISTELAELSGWNKKEVYTLINQNKQGT